MDNITCIEIGVKISKRYEMGETHLFAKFFPQNSPIFLSWLLSSAPGSQIQLGNTFKLSEIPICHQCSLALTINTHIGLATNWSRIQISPIFSYASSSRLYPCQQVSRLVGIFTLLLVVFIFSCFNFFLLSYPEAALVHFQGKLFSLQVMGYVQYLGVWPVVLQRYRGSKSTWALYWIKLYIVTKMKSMRW